MEVVDGQIIYTPISAKGSKIGYEVRIGLNVCDLVNACTGESYVTIKYLPLEGYEDYLSEKNSSSLISISLFVVLLLFFCL